MNLDTLVMLIGGGAWASLHVHVWYINKRIDKVEKSVDRVTKQVFSGVKNA